MGCQRRSPRPLDARLLAAEDPAAEVERLAGHGIVIRSIPSANLLARLVGAWSSEEEIERLAELAAR